MSEWSQDLANKFHEVESANRLKSQIQLHNSTIVSTQGPSLFDEFAVALDMRAAELNRESKMLGIRVMADTNIPHQVTLRRSDGLATAPISYDSKQHCIRVDRTDDGRFNIGVVNGTSQAAIFTRSGPVTPDEFARIVLYKYVMQGTLSS